MKWECLRLVSPIESVALTALCRRRDHRPLRPSCRARSFALRLLLDGGPRGRCEARLQSQGFPSHSNGFRWTTIGHHRQDETLSATLP
jgi:hypothetical protein